MSAPSLQPRAASCQLGEPNSTVRITLDSNSRHAFVLNVGIDVSSGLADMPG